MKIQTIIISNDDRDNLQRLNIEVESRKSLMAYLIEHNINSESEQYKKYEEEYKKYFLQFEQAKQNLQNKYIDKTKKYNWFLNYEDCKLEITYQNE